jgi:hypothetical protein
VRPLMPDVARNQSQATQIHAGQAIP